MINLFPFDVSYSPKVAKKEKNIWIFTHFLLSLRQIHFIIMEGYIQKLSGGKLKRYVQFLEISSDPELVAQYRKWHSEEYSWKEVRDGIMEVGILEMEIYILGSKLVMIVDTAPDFQWDEAMSRLATLPRQAEWEAFVSKFQGCSAEARSDEKWQPMERMFRLY